MPDLNLPPAELDVMACLWRGLDTAAAIRAALVDERPMTHASVCTLLKRLEEKGLVRRKKGPIGKAYLYRAAVQPTGPSRSMLTGLLDRLFHGNGVALVASLLQSRPPSEPELDELESLLQRLRSERAGNSSVVSSKKRIKKS